ncbi:MAG: ABC transporter ATP-binding protein [Pseudomonadota bacterium]|nr:ABC transporter ATP-binding protein [Pseudomonadota bacterium]
MKRNKLKKLAKNLVHEEQIEHFSDLQGVGYLLSLSREHYHRLMAAIFLLVCSVASLMLAVRVLGTLLQKLSEQEQGIQTLVLTFLALEVVAAALRYFGSVRTIAATNSILCHVRIKLFQKLTRLPISYYDQQPSGRILSRITTDVEGVEHFFANILARSLCSILEILLIIVAMLIIDLHFGLIIVATSIPTLLFTFVLRQPLKFWLRVHKKLNAIVLARFVEYINGFEIIKSFNLTGWCSAKLNQLIQNNYHAHLILQRWNSFIRPTIVILCQLPVFFIALIGGQMVLENTLELAIFVSFMRFCVHLLAPVRSLAHDIQVIQDALTSAERVRQTFLEHEEKQSSDRTSRPVRGDVRFNSIYMDYHRDKNVLQGVSFHAKQGMKIGLVGETGAGKTSTVNLIPALYNYTQGDILIDGIPQTQWSKECLRKHIGYINQDVVIFHGTLRENIICAQQVNDDEIKQLIQRLNFEHRLASFPQGLDSIVLEHGQNISAGERQLIAFMRMMLKNPQILILDEATANVDHTYETAIHKTLFKLMADKTCFIIAHRLATVRKCDLILVFKDGHIVEQGTHSKLTRQPHSYYSHLLTAMGD